MLEGIVLKGQNGLYTVSSANGTLLCRAASRIRKEDGVKILAGDFAVVSENPDGTGFIERVKERRNFFVRPPVANVDILAIVASAVNPAPMLLNIDKMCCIAEAKHADVMLIFTKDDLQSTGSLLDIYTKTPYKCFSLGDGNVKAADEIKAYMRGRLTVLSGASGVGKSTLLSRVFPSISAEAGELSKRIMRGKNTTRTTEIYSADGAFIADTPGFSMLDYEKCLDVEAHDLITLFPEAAELLGKCRYTKCTHTKEDGCAVIEAVRNGQIAPSRHESYVKLYAEAKAITHYKNT